MTVACFVCFDWVTAYFVCFEASSGRTRPPSMVSSASRYGSSGVFVFCRQFGWFLYSSYISYDGQWIFLFVLIGWWWFLLIVTYILSRNNLGRQRTRSSRNTVLDDDWLEVWPNPVVQERRRHGSQYNCTVLHASYWLACCDTPSHYRTVQYTMVQYSSSRWRKHRILPRFWDNTPMDGLTLTTLLGITVLCILFTCEQEQLGINLHCVDAKERFLGQLEGCTEPEAKRKIIGKTFIHVFQVIE